MLEPIYRGMWGNDTSCMRTVRMKYLEVSDTGIKVEEKQIRKKKS